jgi:hypothetical protein
LKRDSHYEQYDHASHITTKNLVLEQILSHHTELSKSNDFLNIQNYIPAGDYDKEILDADDKEWFKKDWKIVSFHQTPLSEEAKDNAFSSDAKIEEYFSKFNDVLLGKAEIPDASENFKLWWINECPQSSPSVTEIESSSTRSPVKQTTSNQSMHEEEYTESSKVTQNKVFSIRTSTRHNSNREKTTEYFYLLERKAIRMMRRYYKDAFELYANRYKYKQNMKNLPRHIVDKYFLEYVQEEFKAFPQILDHLGLENLWVSLETIILCDRYKKSEPLTKGLRFEEIRLLLNKYSSKLLKKFLENKIHSFLFVHYYKMRSIKDAKEQNHVDGEKLVNQMAKIYNIWRNNLPCYISNAVACEVY